MQEIVRGTLYILLYFIVMASTALLCRYLFCIPNEVFRKTLHMILVFSLIVFTMVFDTWYIAAIVAIGFAIVVYPILVLLERIKGYSQFVTERKKGELKSSLLLVFFMFSIVIGVCWGIFNDRYLVLASIFAWGFGDAIAALVGKKYGKHKLKGKYLDGRKSVEGSFSMFVTSWISVLIVLIARGNLSILSCIGIAFVVAIVSMMTELYSKEGMDTIICPLSAMVVLLSLVHLLKGVI